MVIYSGVASRIFDGGAATEVMEMVPFPRLSRPGIYALLFSTITVLCGVRGGKGSTLVGYCQRTEQQEQNHRKTTGNPCRWQDVVSAELTRIGPVGNVRCVGSKVVVMPRAG